MEGKINEKSLQKDLDSWNLIEDASNISSIQRLQNKIFVMRIGISPQLTCLWQCERKNCTSFNNQLKCGFF